MLYRYFGDFAGLARAWAEGENFLPKTRELRIVELLRTSPVTDALDDMSTRFGREMRGFVTAAMTYLALRADAVPDYYWLRLDRDADWARVEQMLERIAARVLGPAAPGDGEVSASGPASRPPRPRP